LQLRRRRSGDRFRCSSDHGTIGPDSLLTGLQTRDSESGHEPRSRLEGHLVRGLLLYGCALRRSRPDASASRCSSASASSAPSFAASTRTRRSSSW
jgi:hypothetical protein